MSMKRWWLRLICLVAIALIMLTANPQPSQAALGTQAIEQPATLIGPRAGAPIPLYLRPAANQPNVGYGNNGASVTVLEQVASFLPEADQDSAWNHIRLDEAPYTEGWVQGRFLSLSTTESETASE